MCNCNIAPATGWNLRSSFQFANQLVISVGMVLMTFSLIMTSADTYTLMCSLQHINVRVCASVAEGNSLGVVWSKKTAPTPCHTASCCWRMQGGLQEGIVMQRCACPTCCSGCPHTGVHTRAWPERCFLPRGQRSHLQSRSLLQTAQIPLTPLYPLGPADKPAMKPSSVSLPSVLHNAHCNCRRNVHG